MRPALRATLLLPVATLAAALTWGLAETLALLAARLRISRHS